MGVNLTRGHAWVLGLGRLGRAGLTAAALLCAATACRLPGGPVDAAHLPPGTGGLTLHFGDVLARTLTPPIVMQIASFDIYGTGPNPLVDTFEVLGNTNGELELVGLSPGQWLVEIEARNPFVEGDPNQAGTVIGYGKTDPPLTVRTGLVTSAQITITPLQGQGTLQLTLTFPPNTLKKDGSGYLQGTLIHSDGSVLELGFTFNQVNNPTRADSSTAAASGYHTLLLRLVSDSGSVWGRVEAVRIVTGQTTSAAYTLN